MSVNNFQLAKLIVLPSGLIDKTLVGATAGTVNSPPAPDPSDAGKVVVLGPDGAITGSLLIHASGGGGGGGGSTDFSQITGNSPSTNTTLTVGAFSVLTFTSGGIINANLLYGTPISAVAPTVGQVLTAVAVGSPPVLVGTWQTPSSDVISVNGQTGVVVLQLAQTFSPITHEFVTGYNASTGLFSAAQPTYTDISGTPNLSVYALLSGAAFTGTVSAPTIDVTASLSLNGTVTLLDGTGTAGTSGYVLSSTGTGTAWVPQTGGSNTLAALTDVQLSALANGQVLTYVVTGLQFADNVTDLLTPSAWTNSGCTTTSAEEISGGVTSILANPSNYAYIDTGVASFANTVIQFSVWMASNGLCDFYFGQNSSGIGIGLRLDTRSPNSSGFFSAGGHQGSGGNTFATISTGVWHTVVITINSAGTQASWSLDGTPEQTGYGIALNGSYIGISGDFGSQGAYFSEITVVTTGPNYWENKPAPVISVNGQTGTVVLQLPQTFTPVTHEFLTGYTASTGLFTAAQPAYTDISGTPNLSVYALLAGATFTGTVSVPTLNVTTSLSLNGTVTLLDGTGSAGVSGQILSSTGTATEWVSSPVTFYATTIGDGSTLAYTVTHGLNTEDIIVEVHNISTGEMEVVDVDIISTTQITVTFGTAPSLNSERVVVLSSGGNGSSSGSGGGALTLLEQHTASGSATLDFTTAISSTYDDYVIEVLNLQPATDNATFLVQLSTDGGSTWDTSSANYVGGSHYTRMDSAGFGDNAGETSFAGAYLTNAYGTANPGVTAKVSFFNSASAVWRQFLYQTSGIGSGNSGYYTQTGGAIWKSTSQANALRFFFDSGSIASGVIRIYGVSKTSSGGSSGGGGGIYPTMTPPVSTNFTWHNPSSFTETTTDLTTKMLVVFPTSATGLWLVQNTALPATPYTIDLGAMIFAANNINVVNVLLSNVGLTNARAFGSRVNTESGEYGAWYITDQSWSGPASPGAENSTYTFDGMSASQHIVFVRVTNDGTNINVYWSANGENYILLETVTVVSLGFTPASTGIVFYNFSGAMNVWCYHWLVSGSILPQNS